MKEFGSVHCKCCEAPTTEPGEIPWIISRECPIHGHNWGLPALEKCPRCGRPPKLRSAYLHIGGRDGYRYRFRYECRRWLGLRICHAPDEFAWIDTDWGDLGILQALRKWNKSVNAKA